MKTAFLPPIPGLYRRDPEHRYYLQQPGRPDHEFPVSVTGVLACGKTAYAMERIEATRAGWKPRGRTVHLALECLLQGRLDELQPLTTGDYADWVGPLIALPRWGEVTVIASERPTCCLRRNISGTFDCAFEDPALPSLRGPQEPLQGFSGHPRVLADLKTLSAAGATYSTAAQLGGYMALEATHGHHYDYGQTIWSRPGKAWFSPLYSRSDCLHAWALAWALYRSGGPAPEPPLDDRLILL